MLGGSSLSVLPLRPRMTSPSSLARVCWISGSPGSDIFPASLSWQQLAKNLSLMWRCLSEDALMDRLPEAQLEVLARKCPGYRPGGGFQVTWGQFQGVALAPHSFSLWEWFLAAIGLVRGHLLGPWKRGLIAGFLGRQEAEQLVGGQPQGTFLLRYMSSDFRISPVKSGFNTVRFTLRFT